MTGLMDKLRVRTYESPGFDDFDLPIESCKLSEVKELPDRWGGGTVKQLDLNLSARYRVPHHSSDKVHELMRANAEAAIAKLLYDDVIEQLRKLLCLIGEGKRQESFEVILELLKELSR